MMIPGNTCPGRVVASGMAPSVIPIKAINIAEIPADRSSSLTFRSGRIRVASPEESGGTETEQATAPIIMGFPAVIDATPNRKATLLIGPPMSIATIAPKINPSNTEVDGLADSVSSMFCSNVINAEIGPPNR